MYPDTLQKQGECCPIFWYWLLWLGHWGNAAQILVFAFLEFGCWVWGPWVLGVGFWVLGFRFEVFGFGYSLDHPKVAKITSKSTQNRSKIIKSWYLGWLWAPLGSPWGLLGTSWGPDAQKHQKRQRCDPPRRRQRSLFLSIVRYFLGYCFWYQFLYHF